MSSCKEFLKDLEYFCTNENGLEEKKELNRKPYNFKRLMNEFEAKKQDENTKAKYDSSIAEAKALVSKLGIVHNIGLDSLVGVIQNGALLSIDEMEKRDISFNFRISYRGINDDMHKFVFGTVQKGDPIYGLYEIKFKKEIETVDGACFLPKSFLEYGLEVVKEYIMDIKNWRTYLAEEIAHRLEEPEGYLRVTPVHLRPEFLFVGQIPVSFFENIICYNEKAYKELVKRVKEEFGESDEILKIIKM